METGNDCQKSNIPELEYCTPDGNSWFNFRAIPQTARVLSLCGVFEGVSPLVLALDHHNYARWIPIHIHDMESLDASIRQEFEECGHWVVQKSTNRFSSIPIDQAHEQNNALVKGSGGVVGLTENPSAFRKWMTVGPEQA